MLIKVANSETNKYYNHDGLKAIISSFMPNFENFEIVSTGADFIILKASGTMNTDVMLDSQTIFSKLADL